MPTIPPTRSQAIPRRALENYKVKFMCSYGGKIHPRPHDNQLSYVGGETKILAVDRSVKFAALLAKLIALCDYDAVSFKYQLPGEDLDALISVTNDDDLEHMMHEYDRLNRISPKPARLRIFIFPSQSQSLNSSVRSFGSDEARTDKERFVDALNSAPNLTAPLPSVPPAAIPPPVSNVDFLFGFEKSNAMTAAPPPHQQIAGRVSEFEEPVTMPAIDDRLSGSDPIQKHIQDLQKLRIEEQQAFYRRKSDDNFSVGSAGGSTGGENNRLPDMISQVPLPGGVPYGGVFPANTIGNEQQVFMIPAPASAYHAPAPVVRPVNGAPTQGFYTIQRTSPEVYRDQQHIYSMIPQAVPSMATAVPSLPQQKVAGYSEGYGMMVRPPATGGTGMVTEAGYAHVAYDSGSGRQVVYSAPGGVIGQPAQYHGMAAGARPAAEGGGKAATKATQASL